MEIQPHLGSDSGSFTDKLTSDQIGSGHTANQLWITNIEISNMRTSTQVCAQRLPQCLSSPNVKSVHLIFASFGQGASYPQKTLTSTRLREQLRFVCGHGFSTGFRSLQNCFLICSRTNGQDLFVWVLQQTNRLTQPDQYSDTPPLQARRYPPTGRV